MQRNYNGRMQRTQWQSIKSHMLYSKNFKMMSSFPGSAENEQKI